jgi:hypothetical protein
LITGISLVSHYPERIQHIKAYGSMNGTSKKNYIGVVAARRDDNWAAIKAIPLADEDWGNHDDKET